MINAKNINETEREYAVLGSTGNVYTITIGTLHNCTCPDFQKGNLCKHVFFVLLKVLRVPSNSIYVYQKALLKSELHEIFQAAPLTLFGSSVLANSSVRNKYKQSMGGTECEHEEVERKDICGDCPVCMEELDGNEATTWCRGQCGNNVHVECFKEWRDNQQRMGQDVVCMFCRSEWIDGPEIGSKSKKKKKTKHNEGYMNMAEEQGMSRRRDTSSYYRNGWNGYGRRRGYGYWRNNW